MANKMRKFFAWVMVLTLLAGQLALPAAADTVEAPAANVEVTVDVAAALPEEPAAEPQAPAPSDNVTVTTSESVTTVTPDPAAGVTENSTSSTTEWFGSEGGTTTSGSETTTNVSGTHDTTGQVLYEGGTTSGSETTVTTSSEEAVEAQNEEGNVDKEIITSITSTDTSEGTASTSEDTSSTETGDWTNVQEKPVEGDFAATGSTETSETETTILGEEVVPEGGVDIDLTQNEEASDPENGSYTFTGTGTGEIIDLENIPDSATLVKDEDGNVIGYTLSSTKEKITDTTVVNGTEQKDGANSSTDTTGTTSAVTPDLDTAAQKLNIHIDDKSQITEETDETGKVTAYVVTNTTETEEKYDAYDELPIPEAGVFQQTDGSTITRTVEESQDDQGNRVLKIVTIQTDKNGGEVVRTETTQTIIDSAPMEPAKPVTNYILPTRPAPSTKTENGVTTAVTVTDILDAEGNIIGFKSTTVKTDANGAELYREENDLYGTQETITETVNVTNPQTSGTRTVKTTTVETNRVTAEQTVYEDIAAYTRVNSIVHDMEITDTQEMVQVIDGKLYYIYTGSVTVSEGDEHGDVKLMKPLDILESLFAESHKLDLESGGGDAYYTDDWGYPTSKVDQSKPTEGFKYVGYGIDTALNISKGNESSDVVQFRLKGANGEEYYAMCIDFNTTIQPGHLYDIDDLTNEDYYQQSGSIDVESAEKIRIIALNGYWGTADDENSTDDIGSLNEVKNLLSSYLTAQGELDADEIKEIVDSLTPGQTLAATQAALWKYGNIDGNKQVNEDNLVPNGYDKTKEWVQDNRGHWHEKEVSEKNEDYINTEYVYNALLDLANDPDTTLEKDEGVEFLDAEDITATSIVVKEKVASAGENGNTANVYNTDLNFTLGIEPTKLFGDLKVTVYDDNGKEIRTAVLATKDTTIIGLQPDDNGMYTIKDIEIAEGISVNLNLYGTQDLGTGVYIYTSLNDGRTDSQTLVTLATGSRKVDLDIEMRLDVQEPTAEKTTTTETTYGKRTDTQKQTRTDKTTRKTTTTTNDWTVENTQKTESEKIYTSDVTLTQIKTTETKSERTWNFSWIKFFDPEPQEQDDSPENPPTVEPPKDDSHEDSGYKALTPEKANPKVTAVPRTGDLSGIWLAVSGLSLGGVALLNKKRKNHEE